MKPATTITLLVAWIWVFQGCDTRKAEYSHKGNLQTGSRKSANMKMHNGNDRGKSI